MESRSNSSGFLRAWGGLCGAVIVVLAGINLLQTARRTPAVPHFPSQVSADVAMRHEQRFGPLRAALVTHQLRGTLGYFADLSGEAMRNDSVAMEEYFLTQFVLIPAVLEADAGACDWAVTNFHQPATSARVPTGFRVVQEFGDGVRLLRKEKP